MPRETTSSGNSYVYDTSTGKWVPASPSIGSAPSSSTQDPEDVPSSVTGNDSNSEVDSKADADKEYIEVEFNTLVGDLSVIPSKKAIRIKVNDTVEILGVGRFLSGKYFVSAIKRTISNDNGYSQTLTVMKNGFGDSLKNSVSSTESTQSRSEKVEKSAPTIKKNDLVKIVGEAIYTNGVPVPAWVKEKTLTVQQVSSDGTRVLLMPISSWTYSRYIQKV